MPKAMAKFERISLAELKAKLPLEKSSNSGNKKNFGLVDGTPIGLLKRTRKKSRKALAMEPSNVQLRLLLIDDEPAVSTLLSERLSHAGFVCQTATRGVAALELLKHRAFDAIIWDLKMPGMSDLDLVAQLRRTHPSSAFRTVSAGEGVRLGILAMEQVGQSVAVRHSADFLSEERKSALPAPTFNQLTQIHAERVVLEQGQIHSEQHETAKCLQPNLKEENLTQS